MRKIINKYKSNNLDYNIMCIVLVTVAILGFVSLISNSIIGYPFKVSIKWLFLMLYAGFALVVIKNKRKMKYIKITTMVLIAFVLIPYNWFTAGGSSYYTLLYVLMIVALAAVVLRGKGKIVFISLFALLVEGLFLIEHLKPSAIVGLNSHYVFLEGLIQIPLIILLISITVSLIIGMYRKQQKTIQEYNKKLMIISKTDALTNVHNRGSIIEIFERNLVKASEGLITFQALIIDIDNFKKINDTYGHQQGDAVIREMCHIIEDIIKGDGMIGRYGGDEFLILFNNISYEKAKSYSKQIKELVRLGVTNGFIFTISGGLVNYHNELCVKDIIYKADILLFEAKKRGKNIILDDSFINDALSLKSL